MPNWISKLFFNQQTKLIYEAIRSGEIKQGDIDGSKHNDYEVDSHHTQFSLHLMHSTSKVKGLKLMTAFLRTFAWSWLFIIIGKLLLTCFIILSPLLSNQILSLAKNHAGMRDIIIVLLLILLQKGIKSLLAVHVNFVQYRIGSILYGQLAQKIFDKDKAKAITRGKILNLLEEDSYRLINLSYFMVQVILVPMQLAYGIYTLSYTLGLGLFINHLYIFAGYFLFCGILAWVDLRLNRRLMGQKDLRSEKTFKFIKAAAEGNTNQDLKQQCIDLRNKQLKTQRTLYGIEVTTRSISSIVCNVMLIVTLINVSGQVSSSQVFSLILLFNELRYPCMQFPSMISNFMQNYVSLGRLEDELTRVQEKQMQNTLNQSLLGSQINSSEVGIAVPSTPPISIYTYLEQHKSLAENIAYYSQFNSQLFEQVCFITCLNHYKDCKSISETEVHEKDKVRIAIAREIYLKGKWVVNRQLTERLGWKFVGEIKSRAENTGRVVFDESMGSTAFFPQDLELQRKQSVEPQTATPSGATSGKSSFSFQHGLKGNVGFHTYSQYFKISSVAYLLIPFLLCTIASQVCSMYSSLTYKQHTSEASITFSFSSILFYTPFLSLLPTLFSLTVIFTISLKSSGNLFSKVLSNLPLEKFGCSVLLNRLTNDLKFLDKNFCICVSDITATIWAIIGSLTLSQMAIWDKSKVWVLAMVVLIVAGVGAMAAVNRRAMWAVRELLRVQGAARTLSIAQMCQTTENKDVVRYYGKEKEVRQHFLQYVNRIVKTHLCLVSVNSWLQTRMLIMSLVLTTLICSLCIVLDIDVLLIGLVLSSILSLDDLFQTFFLNLVNLQKSAVAVERCVQLVES